MEIHSTINTASYPQMRRAEARGEAVPAAASESQVVEPASREDPRAIEESAASEPERGAEEGDQDRAVTSADGQALSADDRRLVEQLKTRDTEVRTHEQAHVAAGGPYVTSGPTYTYQIGPDGKRYAIGGEVGIDTSAIPGDPEASMQKAEAIIRAAMAPAEPSGQDHRVAASARAMRAEAQQAFREEQLALQETVLSAASSQGGPARASASNQETTDAPGLTRERLEQRIAAFFADPVATGLSRFA